MVEEIDLDALARGDRMGKLVDIYTRTKKEERAAVEAALITAIGVYGQNNRVGAVVGLLARNDLSDAIIIKAIGVCAESGWMHVIADLIGKEGLGPKVREVLEPALLRAIEVCGERGWVGNVTELLRREGLSPQVREAAQRVVDNAKNPLTKGGVQSGGRTPAPKAGTTHGTGRAPQMRVRT